MGLIDYFRKGLQKTRAASLGGLKTLFQAKKLDRQMMDELEAMLLMSDVGVEAVENLLATVKTAGGDDLRHHLRDEMLRTFASVNGKHVARFGIKPWVILLAGVNGSGKTTTAGKLAWLFSRQGKRVVIAAADTFRAAAVSQLEIWAERGGARLIKQAGGVDPAAVAFDAVSSILAKGEDVLLIDTAGRLQTRKNLMDELEKINRVVKKVLPGAPHETLLVIDATTGQNGLSQAKGFAGAGGVSGIVITKLDGTARGGIVIPIAAELGLPVEFVGVGEGLDDLLPFDPNLFVDALLEQ